VFDPHCFSCREFYRIQLEEAHEHPAASAPDHLADADNMIPGPWPDPADDDQLPDDQLPDEPPRSLLSGMVDGAWLDAQEFAPLEWVVDGILTEGFGLLVAPPKAGKSWMVAGIGLACAAGGYALGSILVKQRPVLYLALEDGHRRLQSRFRTLTEGQ